MDARGRMPLGQIQSWGDQHLSDVLETAANVAERSKWVRIDNQALRRFSRRLTDVGITAPALDAHYHFCDNSERTVSYFLVLDSLNFCFWPLPGKSKWEIQFGSELLSGYYGLAASLKKAVLTGVAITHAEYLAEISSDQLKQILGGRGELQLLGHRVGILKELGRLLIRDYKGKSHKLVEAAGSSAIRLVQILAEKLPSFSDIAEHQGRAVFFYKRAQIFAADLFGTFKGKKWGLFSDMDQLTAFADYKLPQVLRHLGILVYAPVLAQKVDQKVFLAPGSQEEVEIRANTIWAVELIRRELKKEGRPLRSFEIDWILWNLGQGAEFKARP
jgi:hypothetical protein